MSLRAVSLGSSGVQGGSGQVSGVLILPAYAAGWFSGPRGGRGRPWTVRWPAGRSERAAACHFKVEQMSDKLMELRVELRVWSAVSGRGIRTPAFCCHASRFRDRVALGPATADQSGFDVWKRRARSGEIGQRWSAPNCNGPRTCQCEVSGHALPIVLGRCLRECHVSGRRRHRVQARVLGRRHGPFGRSRLLTRAGRGRP